MHTFKDNYHTMSLTLNYASDLEKPTGVTSGGGAGSGGRKVGDTVNFKGGYQYISSVSSSPVGGTRKAGPAKITHIAEGAKHPYHIVGGAYNNLDGNSNVYGWVDAGTIS